MEQGVSNPSTESLFLFRKVTGNLILPEILDHKDSATAMNVYVEATRDAKVKSFESLQGKWRFTR